MNVTISTNKKVLYGLLGLLFSLAISVPIRADLNIAQTPLFLTPSVDPNIMFVLDDSGSMQWEHMPNQTMFFTLYTFPRPANLYGDEVYANQVPDFNDNNIHNTFSRSADNNTVFYNPLIHYIPWVDENNVSWPLANPAAAWYNPADTTRGSLDLTAQQTLSAVWFRNITDNNQSRAWLTCGNPCNHTFWPITFYRYKGAGNRAAVTSYNKYQIRGTNGFQRDLNGGAETAVANFVWTVGGGNTITRTVLQERQNFANWFTYHRSRILASRAGIGRAFAQQGENMRVGFGAINKGSTAIDGVNTDIIINGVRTFTGSDRQSFFTTLYTHPIPTSGTPLRRALDSAGQYFSRADTQGPWSSTPGVATAGESSGNHLECRHSYSILMTDGYWNGAEASTANARNNNDGTNGPTIPHPEGAAFDFTYSAVSPFTDGHRNTLADVAMHYWKRDLRADIANSVPVSTINPAFWQHMVTFGVGLGVEGTVSANDAFDAIDSGAVINWPAPSNTGTTENIDDLLHAGVNSRGGFFSVGDPDTFAKELSDVLSNIVARTEGSSASVATNSTRLDTNTVVYQAKFDSRDWTGQFLAFKICNSALIAASECTSIGSIVTPFVWDAGQKITAQGMGGRSLFSFNPLASPKGIVFEYGNLHPSQQAFFPGGANQVNYIRGDQSQEQQFGGPYRNRTGPNRLLGDLINSDPWFIGNSNFGYNLLLGTEGTDYLVYRSSAAYKARRPLIAIGGNDGMLHVFNPSITGATAGNEVFAYVPHTLFAGNKLASLTDPAYTHQYFVDGSPIAGDAYFDADGDSDKEWRTVLVGTLGAGGKGVFALDMTFLNPNNYAAAEPSFSASRILWEINSNLAGFADLGFTLGQASIVRMANGEFAAVFGNGYNSANHKAVLYIVDIKTGALIKAFDTGVGTLGNPNGLSSPLAVDANSDRVVDAIYAGDLHGNLWKFDVSAADPNNWSFGFDNTGVPAPLFIAKDAADAVQPITAKPQAGLHPNGGLMIYFGTGRYFVDGDHAVSNPQIHTFYGIRDACVNMAGGSRTCSTSPPSITRAADLVKQDILAEQVAGKYDVRVTTNAVTNIVTYLGTKKGWYMDLVPPSRVAKGERVVTQALLRSGRIIFVTLIPDPSPCNYGGTGWLMELDALTGNRLNETPFDISGNGLIGVEDMVSFDLNNDGTADSVSASGKKSKVGIIKTPGVIGNPGGEDETKHTSGSTGAMETTLESVEGGSGRQSWRQLR